MKKIMSIIMISLLTSIIAPSIYGAEQQSVNSTSKATHVQKINIEYFAFTPQKLTIPVGTTIIWTNNDDIPHNVTFEKFGSEKLNKDETFSHTFDTKGTYSYICGVHPSMKGEIIVK